VSRPRKQHPWPDGPPVRDDEAAWLDKILSYATKADHERLGRIHAAMEEHLAGTRSRPRLDHLLRGFDSQALRRWCVGELDRKLNARDERAPVERMPLLKRPHHSGRFRGRLLCNECGMKCPCWIMQKAHDNPEAQQCTRCCVCFAPATPVGIRRAQPENPEADPAGVWWDRAVIGRRT
jgi:hypothetical protein